MIHTTSAGTQGIRAAANADRILLASLVNARATVEYLRRLAPERVSFVCMGFENLHPTQEDTVCAEYMRSLLLGEPYPLEASVAALRDGPGARFFVPADQAFAPEADFYLAHSATGFPSLWSLAARQAALPTAEKSKFNADSRK